MKEENVKCVHGENLWVNPKDRSDYTFEYRSGCYPEILCRKNESYCDFPLHYTECVLYDKWDKE